MAGWMKSGRLMRTTGERLSIRERNLEDYHQPSFTDHELLLEDSRNGTDIL